MSSKPIPVSAQLTITTGPVVNRRISRALFKLDPAPINVPNSRSGPASPIGSDSVSCICGHATPNEPSGNPRLMNPR